MQTYNVNPRYAWAIMDENTNSMLLHYKRNLDFNNINRYKFVVIVWSLSSETI